MARWINEKKTPERERQRNRHINPPHTHHPQSRINTNRRTIRMTVALFDTALPMIIDTTAIAASIPGAPRPMKAVTS